MKDATQGSRWWIAGAWLLALPVLLHPIANPDLFWHLASAETMLETGSIPRNDVLSFTMVGAPWVDFEWLVQLVYLGVHRMGGFAALLALKVLLLVLAGLAVLALFDLHEIGKPARACLFLLWSAASLGRSDLKPEIFSVILFTLELWYLEARRLRVLARPAAWKTAAAACLYFALWANLHPGFALGFLLMPVYALGQSGKKPREMALLAAAGFLGTLLNPYGAGIYSVLAEHARESASISRFILEWQPPQLANPYDGPTWLLFLLAACAYAYREAAGKSPPAAHTLATVIFGALFLLHARQKAYFIPIGLLFLAASAGAASERLARLPLEASRYLLIACGACYLAYVGHYGELHLMRSEPILVERLLPTGAANFIERELLHFRRRRPFNQWGWGGYLSYRFRPEIRVFMDGRYIFHPFLRKIAQAQKEPVAWQRFLLAHDIEWLLLRDDRQHVDVPTANAENGARTVRLPHLPVFYPSLRWAMVYRDALSVLYVRRAAFDGDWIQKHEIR